MRERSLRSLIDAPRWLLLVTLVYAPWAYGCNTPRTVHFLTILTGLSVGSWLLGCLVSRVPPRVPKVAAWTVVGLLVMGWWMAWNAHYRYNPQSHQFLPADPPFAFAPGGFDSAASFAVMEPLTGILGALLFVADFSRSPEWRTRLWWTIGITGASVALFGLVQRSAGSSLMFPYVDQSRFMFFGPFFYHGNAGSFINLVLPAIAGLLLLSVRKAVDDVGRVIWVPSLVLVLVAAGVCFSRTALVITAVLGCALGWWAMRNLPRTVLSWRICLYPALLLIAVVAVVASVGWEPMWQKWRILGSQLNSQNPRLLVSSLSWRMVEDAGVFGFGTGTFELAFPQYMHRLHTIIPGIWKYTQQDYLQTVIEWGWLGAAGWFVLLAGGLIRGVRTLRTGNLEFADRTLLFVSLLALLGVLLHALVDYPLQISSLQLYAATYLGMCWGSPRWNRSTDDSIEARPCAQSRRKVSARLCEGEESTA
jgi:hypothetical protein